MALRNRQLIEEILTRAVADFKDPGDVFRNKLEKNPEMVVIKFGVDPTRPDIHLGHATVLRTLRRFQDLGAKIIFLIGDFTSLIGDPSGQSKVRPDISQQEVESNMKTYLEQVGKILKTDSQVFSWIRNSDWFLNVTDLQIPQAVTYTDNKSKASVTFPADSFLAKAAAFENTRMQKTHLTRESIHNVTLLRLVATLKKITFARLSDRSMFKERLGRGGELYMSEMLYPVLQGIDSSVIANVYGSCDLEVGGADQLFNILMGREIMQAAKQEPQAVLVFKILEGIDGKEKMSKSLDNYIAITDEPGDIYGKVMSIPDTSILNYFELCTYTPLSDIEKISKDLKINKTNPRDIKMRLAREIVEIYHGKQAAEKAEKNFISVFQRKEVPTQVKEVAVKKGVTYREVLVKEGIVSSNSQFRRLIDSGAISSILQAREKIDSYDKVVQKDDLIQIGKKEFLKIKILE